MPNNVGQCFHLGMKQILEKDVQHALVTQHCSGGTTIAEKQVQLKKLRIHNVLEVPKKLYFHGHNFGVSSNMFKRI